jgi:hypothetical protein
MCRGSHPARRMQTSPALPRRKTHISPSLIRLKPDPRQRARRGGAWMCSRARATSRRVGFSSAARATSLRSSCSGGGTGGPYIACGARRGRGEVSRAQDRHQAAPEQPEPSPVLQGTRQARPLWTWLEAIEEPVPSSLSDATGSPAVFLARISVKGILREFAGPE